MRFALALLCCITLFSASSCTSLSSPPSHVFLAPLGIVTVCNKYIPQSAPAPVSHHVDQIRQFKKALAARGIQASAIMNESSENFSQAEFVSAVERGDGPGKLSLVYIASHGSPEGFILAEPLRFEDLYNCLEAETKGRILLIVDMCYSGVMNEVLARHKSKRIFAITGTKGATVERWYAESGSFGRAVSSTIVESSAWAQDGRLTLGELYDEVQAKIHYWNVTCRHSSGHITEAGMFGPRDLVVLEFDKNSL
jgi:hypothetical protein